MKQIAIVGKRAYRRKAVCHPDRKHYAHGVCQQCYVATNPNRQRTLAAYLIAHRDELNALARKRNAEYPERRILRQVKERATRKGFPFNITADDIVIPERCPVLGLLLIRSSNRNHPQLPTLDRIIPAYGYVKGNIRVISYRANMLKNNATADEMRQILVDLERIAATRLRNENAA